MLYNTVQTRILKRHSPVSEITLNSSVFFLRLGMWIRSSIPLASYPPWMSYKRRSLPKSKRARTRWCVYKRSPRLIELIARCFCASRPPVPINDAVAWTPWFSWRCGNNLSSNRENPPPRLCSALAHFPFRAPAAPSCVLFRLDVYHASTISPVKYPRCNSHLRRLCIYVYTHTYCS